MDLAPQTAVTLVIAIAGVAATWGGLRRQIRGLEDAVKRIPALELQVAAIDAKIETIRIDQGRRIGELDKLTNSLAGELKGVAIGLSAARRSRTAAGGHKIGGAE